MVLVAGGRDGSQTVLDVVSAYSKDGELLQTAKLPGAVAYASTITHEETLYLVGGRTAAGVSADVFGVAWDNASIEVRTLPRLPQPVVMAGVAVLEGSLYVVGGVSRLPDGEASAAVHRLPLAVDAAGWEAIEAIPGGGRILPAVAAFCDELHVFGGAMLDTTPAGRRVAHPLRDGWGYRTKPLEGTTTSGWRPLAGLPSALSGAAAIPTGQAHMLLVGGMTQTFSLSDETVPEDAERSDRIWIFHNVTDTWIEGGQLTEAIGPVATAVLDGVDTIIADGMAAKVTLNRTVKRLRIADFAVMLIYFGFMAGIGVYFTRKQDSSEEFALGGRNVKWWAAAVSMFATGASSISFMAIPALAFRTNLVWFTSVLFLIPLCFLQAYVIYPLLRRLNLTSTYEYLERRFNKPLRLIASLQCILFQLLGKMSVVMLLPALAISAVTGMNVFLSVALMGFLTTVYTAFGGFDAVIWTDFAQGVLMLLGAGLMVVMAITGLPGGFSEFVDVGAEFGKFKMAIFAWDCTMPMLWIFGLGLIMQNLAFASDQPVVQRVYATPLKDMRKLAALFCACAVVISLVVNFAGISIFSYFHAHPEMLDPGMSNDQLVPLYIVQRIPVGIAGLIIAALFAASMSTLSSSMNSVATIFCEDFYRLWRPGSTDRERLVVMKVGSLVVGVIGTGAALLMAGMEITSMFETWNVIMALLGGGFIGIYILGMFTRRASGPGVIIGALASVAATLWINEYTSVHWTFYSPVAVLTCIIVGYVASLIFRGQPKSQEGLTVFDMRRDLEG